jgi:hypothetical protein
MPTPRGVTRGGAISAAALEVIDPASLRPEWSEPVLRAAPEVIVRTYVLSVDALRLLLGAEGAGGLPAPAGHTTVIRACASGRLDWISVGKRGRGHIRAFSRVGVEDYFYRYRDGHEPPWHRLPPSVRRSLGINY